MINSNRLFSKTTNTRSEDYLGRINTVALLLVLLIVSLAIPTRIVHIVVVAIAFFAIVLIRGVALDSISAFVPISLCVGFYLLGVLNSEGVVYLRILQDLTGLLLAIVSSLLIGKFTLNDMRKLQMRYMKLITIASLLISVIGLIKYYLLVQGKEMWIVAVATSDVGRAYPWGTSLVSDYNMFSLCLTLGLVAASYLYSSNETTSSWWRPLSAASAVLCVVTVLFAGSRRGWTILGILTLLAVAAQVRTFVLTQSNKITSLTDPIMRVLFGIILLVSGVFSVSYFSNLDVQALENGYAVEALVWRFGTITGETQLLSEATASRTELWEFGLELISTYSLPELLFGRGFDYLTDYAHAFPETYSTELYPHNPLLSAFHYSGLIGMLAVLTTICLAVWRAYRSRFALGDHLLVMICISLSYVLVSGNSIFSFIYFVVLLVVLLEIDTGDFRFPMPF